MKNLSKWQGCRGFTLIELLVVMAMLGIFMTAVYGTYIGNQRTSSSQQEVSEVQQNLRVGMESLSQDLLNAGFLCTTQTVVGTATTLTVYRGSDSPRNPRIIANGGIQMVLKAGGGWYDDGFKVGAGCFPVTNKDDLALYKTDGTSYVRIVVPQDGTDPYKENVLSEKGSRLVVTGIHAAAAPPHVCLAQVAGDINPTQDIAYLPGYIIASGEGSPNIFTYALDANNDLTRSRVVNGVVIVDVIAENISAVRFQYQLESGALQDSAVAADSVKAVRITLTSQTEQSARTGGIPPKVRQLVATYGVRN